MSGVNRMCVCCAIKSRRSTHSSVMIQCYVVFSLNWRNSTSTTSTVTVAGRGLSSDFTLESCRMSGSGVPLYTIGVPGSWVWSSVGPPL